MRRLVAAYLGAVVVIAWAVATAWRYLRRDRSRAEPCAEPEWDTYQAAVLAIRAECA